jgi:NADH-quinone oxidoreductase subunit N
LDIFAGLPLFFRAAFSSFLFSLAGIPPFAGFFGKFLVFCVLAVSGLLLPAILLLLVSVMTAYYYIRFVRILFFFGNILRTLVLPISFILGITLGLVVLFNSGFVFFQGFLLDTLVLSI